MDMNMANTEDNSDKNALSMLMARAKHPGAFAFDVKYPRIGPNNATTAACVNYGNGSNDDDEGDAYDPVDDLLKQLDGSCEQLDKNLEDALLEIHRRVFRESDAARKANPFYPMYCLDDKKRHKRKSTMDRQTEREESTTETPKDNETRVAEKKRCDRAIDSQGVHLLATNPDLPAPRTTPPEGSYVTAITACFGSQEIKRLRRDFFESDDDEDSTAANVETKRTLYEDDESDNSAEDDESDNSAQDDESDNSSEDDESDNSGNLNSYCETLKDGDIGTYFQEITSSFPANRPYLPIVGFILTFSDGLQVEIGSLRGTTSEATLTLAKGEHVHRMTQYTCRNGGSNQAGVYPVSVGIETSDHRCIYFQQACLKANFGGTLSGDEKAHGVPVSDDIPGGLFLEWDDETNCIKKFFKPKKENQETSNGGKSTPSLSCTSPVDKIDLFQRNLKWAEGKKDAACKLDGLYIECLYSIRSAAIRSMMDWFLAQNNRLVTLKSLNRRCMGAEIKLNMETHKLKVEFKHHSAKVRSQLQREARENAIRRYRQEKNLIQMDRDLIMRVTSDLEIQNLLKNKDKILSGVEFHLSTLSSEFETYLQFAEDQCSLEKQAMEASLAMTLASQKEEKKIVVCMKGCYKEISDPSMIRKGKRCSFSGCFDQSPNCGCCIADCKRCFAPLCPGHKESHEKSCASTFTQRCGWKEGLPSLRFQDKCCGSLLQEDGKFECISCGVQSCRDCGILCAGYQPRMYCIPLLGPPPKKHRFLLQACSRFCCVACQQKNKLGGFFGVGRCPTCSNKHQFSYQNDPTGYSEPSDMDSDFVSDDSFSLSEDEDEQDDMVVVSCSGDELGSEAQD